jgi:hypothetical protein
MGVSSLQSPGTRTVMDAREHWDATYRAKGETGVSWFQERPGLSLQLIERIAPGRSSPIIDIGGGASRLVDGLIADGYRDLTVLDISKSALAATNARLGNAGARVAWLTADVTAWEPRRTWRVWHDRAVFHFFTSLTMQDAYLHALDGATEPGSSVIIATFALDGPEKCSGLPVQRYSAETLSRRLGPSFRLETETAERHRTPGGVEQSFTYAVFIRV